tara:strand:- start:972 stop:1430 length:459 start_codon:yes stop_codon:yes gene_type:complete
MIHLYRKNKVWVHKEGKTILKHFFVGVIGAIIQFSLFIVFMLIWGEEYYLSSTTVAFGIALSITFILHKFWTYKDPILSSMYWQFSWFVAFGIGNIILNGLVMYILIEWAALWYLVAQIVTIISLSIISFVVNRLITFNLNETSNSNRDLSS